MNRLLHSHPRATSLCAAALSLPCLLAACSSQAVEPAASENKSVSSTTSTPTAEASSTQADDTTKAAASDEATRVGKATSADEVGAVAEAAPAKAAGYTQDREVPPGMTEAQMKKIWVPIPPANFAVGKNPRVRLTTSKGAVVLALDPKAAPLHTRSFVYLSKRGYFDNTTFHRWADLTGQGGAIIQGGDPLSRSEATREMAGTGGPGYRIPRERNQLTHKALVIAAARTQDPDSAGSQFYITQAPTDFLDEGDGYTVFGRVVEGGEVAKKLRQDDKILRAQVLK